MTPTAAAGSSRDRRTHAQERDARIYWLLDMHPVTAAMLVQLGLFPSRKKALRRLQRLVQRKRIRLLGTIWQHVGRPENVWGRWAPPAGHLLHEVELTRMCFRLDAEKIFRGPHVIDRDIYPDAEVWINGDLYYLEWDRGTEGYLQVVKRFRKYERCRNLVLWVCPTQLRREGMRARAAVIRHIALFTTAGEALASPHGEIWIDYHGARAALPRQTAAARASGVTN